MSKKNNPATRFGKLHAKKTKLEKEIKEVRQEFLDQIKFEESELSQISVFAEVDDPEAWVAVNYPRWQIVAQRLLDPPNEWGLLLKEKPEYKPYVFVNPEDHKVYQRIIAEGMPDVDMDRLHKEDPELWMQLTEQPPPPERKLRDLDTLSPEELQKLKSYLTPPKLEVRMAAPREAKPEELEG